MGVVIEDFFSTAWQSSTSSHGKNFAVSSRGVDAVKPLGKLSETRLSCRNELISIFDCIITSDCFATTVSATDNALMAFDKRYARSLFLNFFIIKSASQGTCFNSSHMARNVRRLIVVTASRLAEQPHTHTSRRRHTRIGYRAYTYIQ